MSTIAHADDIDLRGLDLNGEHVAVIGGGLTAGHLAAGAADRGAQVTLVARRPLRKQMFDTAPGWLGPRHLDAFHRVDDPTLRLRSCLAARDGGSVPPWMTQRLHALVTDRGLRIRDRTRICGARASRHRGIELILGDETTVHADRVWLATGTEPDITAHHVTDTLLQQHPITVIDGWPVLDPALRWPGTAIHLMGRPAMLSLGPAAGNLWGARIAATVITDHISAAIDTRRRSARAQHPATNSVV